MPLDEEDLLKIASLLQPATDRILTTEEATRYTKHESDSAFYRWCLRLSVKSVTNGRYSRVHLDRALDRESRKARFRRPAAAKPVERAA